MKNLLVLFVFSLFSAPLFGGIEYSATVAAGAGLIGSMIHVPGAAFMSAIPIQDARGLFTKKLIAVYREMPNVTGFLRSFFEPIEGLTKEVSIEVQRGTEKVAVDVYRHSDGNRNTFDKATEKVIVPPMYDEYFTANEHRLYDMVVAALSENNTAMFAQMTLEQAENLKALQYKIERAIELQASQVLTTGIVELASGDNINFGRKAGSLVAHSAATDWATGTVDPYKTLENACQWIRQNGKAQGGIFNAILGSQALSDFLNNTIVKDRADIRNFRLDDVRAPQKNAVGATLHGEVSAGSYTVRLWGYPEFYDDATGTSTPYIDPKKVIVLPDNTIGKESYSAVPQLIENAGVAQKGRYLVKDVIDQKKTAHEVHIMSAPLIVPVKIDQIYTVQVVAP